MPIALSSPLSFFSQRPAPSLNCEQPAWIVRRLAQRTDRRPVTTSARLQFQWRFRSSSPLKSFFLKNVLQRSVTLPDYLEMSGGIFSQPDLSRIARERPRSQMGYAEWRCCWSSTSVCELQTWLTQMRGRMLFVLYQWMCNINSQFVSARDWTNADCCVASRSLTVRQVHKAAL